MYIRNCPWGYKCDKTWPELDETDNATVRFCSSCKENVTLCSTRDELVLAVSDKKCVAFDEVLLIHEMDPYSPAQFQSGNALKVGMMVEAPYFVDIEEPSAGKDTDIDGQISTVSQWIEQVESCQTSLRQDYTGEARSDVYALTEKFKDSDYLFGWGNYQFSSMIEYARITLQMGGEHRAEDCDRQMERIKIKLEEYKAYLKEFRQALLEAKKQ